MEQRLSVITLGVRDVERTRRFYERGLGWKPSGASNDSIVCFQVEGLVLALYSRAALAADANLADGGGGFGGIALAHNVSRRDDVDAVLAEAARAGATLLKSPAETSWGGYSGYFADPDGHPWEVAWNPHWRLADDGKVVLPG